jgi:predicted nucleic acid-binding protein
MDASALVKLVVPEPESSAVEELVRDRHLVASEVVEVEVRRAARRRGATDERIVAETLGLVWFLPLDEEARRLAATVDPPPLRTLDAIHLATALLVEDLDELISYDDRLAAAARDRGLTVLSPA